MTRARVAALSLACLATLLGCQARGPAPVQAPKAAAPAGLTLSGRLVVKPGGYRLQGPNQGCTPSDQDYRYDGCRTFIGYTQEDVASYVLQLYAGEASTTIDPTAVASVTLVAESVSSTQDFTLQDLRHDVYYRLVVEAYDDAGQLINVTASSTVEFDTVASGGVYETAGDDIQTAIEVYLIDRPFSGSLDVTRSIGPDYFGASIELFEANNQGEASGAALVSQTFEGTGTAQVTFTNLDYNKRYLIASRMASPTLSNLIDDSLATALVVVDDYASVSETLATLTLSTDN